jgi:hypothetical protein
MCRGSFSFVLAIKAFGRSSSLWKVTWRTFVVIWIRRNITLQKSIRLEIVNKYWTFTQGNIIKGYKSESKLAML